jgi:hypothetical protein
MHDTTTPAVDDLQASYAQAVAESIALHLHVDQTWDAYTTAAAEMHHRARDYADALGQAAVADAYERAARQAYEHASAPTSEGSTSS